MLQPRRVAAALLTAAMLVGTMVLAPTLGTATVESSPSQQSAAGATAVAHGLAERASDVSASARSSSAVPVLSSAETSGPEAAPIIELTDNEFTHEADCFGFTAWLSDELSGCLWHLDRRRSFDGQLGARPVGSDINIGNVWSITKGGNVNVAVVDDTWNPNHHDLVDNVDLARSHNYAWWQNPPTESNAAHATKAAGVIAARDNDVGSRGIAPRATLFNYNLVENSSWTNQADAMKRNASIVAVSNNSYGLGATRPRFMLTEDEWWEAVDYGLEHGFGGLGTSYVFAAGNERATIPGRDVSTIGYHAHPGVISACAVDNDGGETVYSNTGVALWVCAPANGHEQNHSSVGNRVLSTFGDNQYSGFGLTSAAAAEVSGVVALMRSVNPYLTWRDVKLILAQTAQKNDPTHASWSNGALQYRSSSRRYSFSPVYGFGVVDASAAVNAALNWKRVPAAVSRTVKSAGPEYNGRSEVPESWDARILSNGETTELTLTGPSDIDFLEDVGVSLYLYSPSGRDLRIELVSPSGTTSTLIDAIATRGQCPNGRVSGNDYSGNLCWINTQVVKLASSEFLGEDPDGTWTLKITDPLTAAGDSYGTTTLFSWQARFLGHAGASTDTAPRARLRVNNVNGIETAVNEGSTVRVTASLSGGTVSQDVVIPVEIEPGTATAPGNANADYSKNGLSIRIPAGQSSGSATFNIAADNISEYDETLSVRWPNPHGASAPQSVLLLGDPVEVTIRGNLAPPGPPRTVTLAATSPTVVEGETAEITVTLSGGAWNKDIVLPVSYGPGTATATGEGSPVDFYPLSLDDSPVTSIRIPAGTTSLTYELDTYEDDIWAGKEAPETLSVVVARPAGLLNEVSLVGSPVRLTIVETKTPSKNEPEISVTKGSDVVEGGDAVFTISASPTPASALDVTVAVSQSGDFGATTGPKTVTVPTSGSVTLRIPTTDDSDDESDGSVTATVSKGTGYLVSSSAASASVAVSDDDPGPVVDPCVTALTGDGSVAGQWTDACDSVGREGRYARFFTFTLAQQATVTIDLESSEDTYMFLRSGLGKDGSELHRDDDGGDFTNSQISESLAAGAYTIEATTFYTSASGAFTLSVDGLPTQKPPAVLPEISITSGGDVAEGTAATFTVTASPAPTAALTVNVTVSQTGDFGATTGTRTVTIPTSGSYTLTVATTGDSTDEPDGSVTATLSTGTGYTVSTTAGTATVAVSDDDDPPPTVPEISIAAGSAVAEGTAASFTITASPSPATALSVSVTVAQSGSFGVATGARTVTIPTGGSFTLTVNTTGDSTDEADGSVTVTVGTGTGYTVSSSAGTATVAVSDDDDPPPPPAGCVSDEVLESARDYYDLNKHRAPGYGRNWRRVLVAFGDVTDDQLTAFTAAEALEREQVWFGWKPFREALECIEAQTPPPPPPPDPEISIVAGSAVTEGSAVSFTITASPGPAANLDVTVTVAQSGNFGVSTGQRTVTIPTTGSYMLTVATTGDSTDEADGSVTVTVGTGTGYTVSTTAGTATVAVSDDDDPPPTVPEISITAGSGVTEGSAAAFTITASPGPAANLDVTVTVAQSGNFGVTTGARTVTIPTTGSYTLTVATTNDTTDETDGSVTVSVNTGTGYTVSTSAGSATVAVSDDDDPPPPPPPPPANCVSDEVLESARDYYELHRDRAPGYGRNWRRVLVAFGDVVDDQLTAFTAAEALEGEQRWFGWRPFREALECIEAAQQSAGPEISIAAGNSVTEGSAASFTITASPAPAANLDVTVTVAQSGNFGAATGTRTVTIPTGGSYTLTVATTGDSTDEADGSVTVTVDTGTGYTVSTTSSIATVAVSDDDDPPPPPPSTDPQISITAGNSVTEGTAASFTITASPAPTANLDVTVTVAQSGNFGVSTGQRTVTIPTSGSYTLTVATTGDSTDEADGSVTVSIDTGTGYTVSTTASTATVAVSDDDVPEISIAAGSGVTEGTAAAFTLTANPTPATALTVTVTITQNGNYGAATGQRTVTIPTSGTYTLTVATTNDSTDETDGSITATVGSGTGYTVSSNNSNATVTVADDDDPPPLLVPTVSVRAGGGVTEGGNATYTITASPAPTAPLTVNLTVSQNGNFGTATGTRTITIPTGGSYTFTVATIDDTTDEPNGTVTTTINTGTGYTVSSNRPSAAVNVYDNDLAPTGPQPTVTVADATADEGAQGLVFVVTLSTASTQDITFRYGGFGQSATLGQDFSLDYKAYILAAGDTSIEVTVPVIDDNTTENTETLRVYVYATSGITIPGYFVYATGTITDND